MNDKGEKIVSGLDASDLRKIEEMKKTVVGVGKPKNLVPVHSLEGGSVWLATHLDKPVSDDLPLYDAVLFWYNFLNKFFSEEFV